MKKETIKREGKRRKRRIKDKERWKRAENRNYFHEVGAIDSVVSPQEIRYDFSRSVKFAGVHSYALSV